MSDALTEDEYRSEVDEQGAWLAEYAIEDVERDTAYEDAEDAVIDLAGDSLADHGWFVRDESATMYGSIIEHADEDTSRFSDWQSLIESDAPHGAVKKLAYLCFEADVIADALDKLTEDEN